MEEKHRERIRLVMPDLVRETTENKFQQMLMKFQRERILNAWMVNKIKSGETFEDRKTILYEMVPKRGPHMYTTLLKTLDELGLQGLVYKLNGNRLNISTDFQNENYNVNELTVVDGCTQGKPVSDVEDNRVKFTPANFNDNDYQVHSNPRGLVLIINIMNFSYRPSEVRSGSEIDVERIKEVWERLGFKVKVKNDLKLTEFEKCVIDFTRNEKFKSLDSAFLFIMTHGKKVISDHPRELSLLTADSLTVSSEWVIEQFNSINCSVLNGKPKIIVFQACRGDCKDCGVVIDTSPYSKPNRIEFDGAKCSPIQSDLLVVYSTLPGVVSQRVAQKGSIFIQELCSVLDGMSPPVDLIQLLNEVTRSLKRKAEDGTIGYYQITHYESFGFDKHFLFGDVN